MNGIVGCQLRCAENENDSHCIVTRTDFVFYPIYVFAHQIALRSLLPFHLETRRSERRSATRPHRKRILNDKQTPNFVTVQTALMVEVAKSYSHGRK